MIELPPIESKNLTSSPLTDLKRSQTHFPNLAAGADKSDFNWKKNSNENSNENSRRRRSGWWDKTINKEVDMNNIKQMMRKTVIICNREQKDFPMGRNEDLSSDFDQKRVVLEPIAPAAESFHQSSARRQIKSKPKRMKDKLPWQDIAPIPLPIRDESRLLSPITKDLTIIDGEKSKPIFHTQVKASTVQYIIDELEDILNLRQEIATVNPIKLYAQLQSNGLDKVAEFFKEETKLLDKDTNYYKLKKIMDNHDFGRAIVLVQHVLATSGSEGISILPSFEDLMYVLSKYLFISLVQKSQLDIAERTLKMIISPLVQKEQKRGGVRSEWFIADFHLLENLISSNTSPHNTYLNFNWDSELSKFWEGMNINSAGSPPLFAYALKQYFPYNRTIDFNENIVSKIEMLIEKLRDSYRKHTPKLDEKKIKNVGLEFERIEKYSNNENRIEFEKNTEYNQKSDSLSSIQSRGSIKFKNDGMPPPSEHETANFALSLCCGPSTNQIRVLDVKYIAEGGQIIAITAGSDKDISVWNIRENQLMKTLNNGSIKPVVCLMFHPSFPELFLSADMEFDVKLWNWKDGSMVRWWKKHHSRIIYQISILPGDDTRAVSCSADQSLKVWNIHSDKATNRGSIHANEPITSFVFCGSPSDPLQQKIIISLSYTIRIYKLRTLSLLHSITMESLKLTKCPIINMEAHPLYDNFILLASDHQLRLYDLNSETIVKTYSARVATNEIRLRGKFSPLGNFIYAGTHQVKHGVNLPNSTEAESYDLTGSLIWRVNTAKLEQKDINAMEETGSKEHAGKRLTSTPVIVSKWMNIVEKSKTNERKMKIFVQSGLDKLLRVYIG